ncbi:MAG TPA: HDOD domain-containing protein [Anaerolineaceae bacterium]|nr:HDOD domain-containing protein [Anaerolineaceae bacterium]
MLVQKLDIILHSVRQLRPMPSSVTRILKEIDGEQTTAVKISNYIGLDQALAAMVLQMSNSVAMGYARDCTTIQEAVMRIGFKRLKTILLASSAAGPLMNRLNGYRLGAGELWRHSLATAVTAEWLTRRLGYSQTEEAYASGLLHDIGKLLLDQYVVSDYSQMEQFIQQYRMPLWQVEEKLLGIDHARVGGLMAEKWQFPIELVDSIRCHHVPSLARSNQKLPAIINLANAIASRIIHMPNGLFSNEIHSEVFNILPIRESDADLLQAAAEKELELKSGS